MSTSRLSQTWVLGAIVVVLVLVGTWSLWPLLYDADRVAPVAPAVAAPLPPVAPRIPPATADDLAPLSERIAAIDQQVAPLDKRLEAIEAALRGITDSVQAMNGQLDKVLAEAAAKKQQSATPRKTRATRTRRSAKRAAAKTVAGAGLPTLVAADQWGRSPSATLRRGDGTLSFHRVGDTVGRARITAIDPATQAIELRIDGKLSTLKVAR